MEFKYVNHYGLNVVKNTMLIVHTTVKKRRAILYLLVYLSLWNQAKLSAALSGKAKVIDRLYEHCYS